MTYFRYQHLTLIDYNMGKIMIMDLSVYTIPMQTSLITENVHSYIETLEVFFNCVYSTSYMVLH